MKPAIVLAVWRNYRLLTTRCKVKKIAAGTHVRYIKLGGAGSWERECLDKGIIRFGFGSANPDRFPLCRAGRWDELRQTFIAERKTQGTATRFTNETRIFFEDDGSTAWITFVGQQLWWGFLTSSAPQQHDDGEGVWRTIAGGWRGADIHGERLTNDRLSGALTKLALIVELLVKWMFKITLCVESMAKKLPRSNVRSSH